MPIHHDAHEWLIQARRGVIELCVLLVVSHHPCYGYDLVSRLSQWEPLAVTEGTLYPLLHRLQKEGYLVAEWQESEAGPPRKYYRLTEAGAHVLQAMTTDWERLASAVTALQHQEERES